LFNFLKSYQLILALGVTSTIGYGTISYSFSLMSLEVIRHFEWSHTFVYGTFSFAIFISALVSPFFGKLYDQIGSRIPMSVGSFCVFVCFICLSQIESSLGYFISLVALEIVFLLVVYEAAFVALTRHYGSHARPAISKITLMGGFASTLFWPLISWLIQQIGWQHTYVLLGFLHLFICLPLHWFVIDSQDEIAKKPVEELSNDSEPPSGIKIKNRRKVELLIAFVFGSMAFTMTSIHTHIFSILEQLSVEQKFALLASTLIGPTQVIARFIEMTFGQKLSSTWIGVIGASAMFLGVSSLLITGTMHVEFVLLFAIFFGIGQGLKNIVEGAIPLQIFGKANYGTTTGRIYSIRLFMTAIAPITAAFLLSQTGPINTLLVLMLLVFTSLFILLYINYFWLNSKHTQGGNLGYVKHH